MIKPIQSDKIKKCSFCGTEACYGYTSGMTVGVMCLNENCGVEINVDVPTYWDKHIQGDLYEYLFKESLERWNRRT